MVYIGYFLMGIGLCIMLLGYIGIYRFQSFYSRIAISSLIDTAGFITVLLGIIFVKGFSFFSMKVVLIFMLMLFLNPLATHTILRNAYTSGLRIGDDTLD